MLRNPFAPPRADLDNALIARRTKPVTVWLLQAIALAIVALTLYVLLPQLVDATVHGAGFADWDNPVFLKRLAILALFASALVGAQFRGRAGRLSGLAAIAALLVVGVYALVLAANDLLTRPLSAWSGFEDAMLVVVLALLVALVAWFRAFGYSPPARAWFAPDPTP